VKHKRFARFHRTHKHFAHARHHKWVKVHGKFVRVLVKSPAHKVMVKKPAKVVVKQVSIKKTTIAK
jgi:hypothetical protein